MAGTAHADSAARPFLTAEWRHLCLVTYAVDAALLMPRLAPGLELDTREGRAFVSLVAFDSLNTRVKGVKWPWHVNFPEINLRFYVRRVEGGISEELASAAQASGQSRVIREARTGGTPVPPETRAGGMSVPPLLRDPGEDRRRGVMFVRELVPRPAISIVAKLAYNEPYASARMTSNVTSSGGKIRVEHAWRFGGRGHWLRVEADGEPFTPGEDSVEHFFKEHSWGFGVSWRGRLLTYRVDHPVWRVFPGPRVEMDVDFAACYGAEWGVLNGAEPVSVVLAEGSGVRVWPVG
jgi:uncharacterized protein